MKFALFAILATTAAASRPALSIQVRDGNFDGLDGLDPSLTWSSATTSGDYDLEVGVDVAARPTADLASLPRSAWGKASRSFGAWGVSARADVQRSDLNSADIEVNANSDRDDLSLKMLANAGSAGSSVSSIQATKGFTSGDARVTVSPTIDMATKDVNVDIGYDAGKTNVEVAASKDEQTIKVSQQIDDDNRVAPSIALRSGKMAVEWERNLGDDNSLTTTLRPNESVDMEWKDSAWTANINMPIDGNSISGANVSVKREVNF
ncbi:hypothetical protein TrRE_jg1798 [Triparma retinervis]|uniref:Uncharacterized protein n=1 Tax=Triparma retinervis TaxID=2557542 RepID=A0A9W7G2F8_9STRA|nr:hypothetical protein TrRE_jg1798 [Triparma retinervis]